MLAITTNYEGMPKRGGIVVVIDKIMFHLTLYFLSGKLEGIGLQRFILRLSLIFLFRIKNFQG